MCKYQVAGIVVKCLIPFLPRDAMHKRGVCRRVVSVWVSVSFVCSVETTKHIFIFSSSASDTILVFPC